MIDTQNYDNAVKTIKTAILQSQFDAVQSVNEKQIKLYYEIGKYISMNSREGFWGKGAIEVISQRLAKELPGLRGFSVTNLKSMRLFYEEWSFLQEEKPANSISAVATAELDMLNQIQDLHSFLPRSFLQIGFTHHIVILRNSKELSERLFYIHRCEEEHYSVESLKASIVRDDYHHQGSLPNNFKKTLPIAEQAIRAIRTFKDEYILNFINTEELGARDAIDVDERIVENALINNIKNFILTFGNGFAFIRNQYHLQAFGEDQFVDLLFFNRNLNCLVAVELKTGKFKTSYLGQLQGYLSILDGFEKKPHENPSIGLILCKDMNKSFVDYVIQDYSRPMGVATYRTSEGMSEELRQALPDIEELRKILDSE